MTLMKSLHVQVKGASCFVCNKNVDYFKWENLIYKVKEDSPVCIPCYDRTLGKMLDFGGQLGDKTFFHGIDKNNMHKEMRIYNDLKAEAPFAQHTTYPRLVEWFELMKDNCEEPIVTCFGCDKEFRNNPQARFEVGKSKYYACSGNCKSTIAGKVKSIIKAEEKKRQIDELMKPKVAPSAETKKE
jgi:hypothetical protein